MATKAKKTPLPSAESLLRQAELEGPTRGTNWYKLLSSDVRERCDEIKAMYMSGNCRTSPTAVARIIIKQLGVRANVQTIRLWLTGTR